MSRITQRMFDRADTDRSGAISKDEFLKSAPNTSFGDRAGNLFSRLDANNDGQLTKEEATKGIERMLSLLHANAGVSQAHFTQNPPFDVLEPFHASGSERDRPETVVA
jgi:hypothetical protein